MTLAATPIVIAWLVVHADDLAGYAGEVRDRLPGQAPAPRCPPFEETVAELRRITAELQALAYLSTELTDPEREALWISYDDVLREACRALGVRQQLDSVVGIELDLERLRVWLGDHLAFDRGQPTDLDLQIISEQMARDTVRLRVDLGLGPHQATAWGCDLTEEYVRINADYTT